MCLSNPVEGLRKEKKVVMEGLDILIATPGRLLDLSYTGALRLKNIKKLVIDEVDEMLNLGFRPQLTSLLVLFLVFQRLT